MSQIHSTPNTPSSRGWLRRIVRVGLPQIVICLTVFLYVATSIGAGHEKERQWAVLFRQLVLILGGTLLALWAVFFTGWNKLLTSLVLLALLGIAATGFRIERDGNLRLTVHARNWVLGMFHATHEDDVKAVRRRGNRAIDLTFQPNDWPGYRGIDRTGIVEGPALSRDWERQPPREIWKQLTYGGYSAFAVVNGCLITMEQQNDQEAVVCYDAATGEELWVHSWPGRFDEMMGGVGPRTTPTVYDGDVFALGALGRLVCLDGKTGDLKWSVETLAGNRNLRWAMSASPLVYGDYVVVNPGTQSLQSAGHALVAYDRKTGKVLRSSGKSQAGYSSPMLVRLSGRWQILLFDGAGLAGCDPDSLEELWRFSWRTNGSDGINAAQPIVVEREITPTPLLGLIAGGLSLQPLIERKGQVFISSAYGRGGALVQVEQDGDGWSAQEVWTTGRSTMRCKFASPVVYDGHIYGLDDGDLQCIDLSEGKVKWTDKREPNEGYGYGHGQLLLAGDLIVVLTEYGEVVLVEARPDKLVELGRRKILKDKRTWNNPAMVNGRLYIRNHLQMACVDLAEK